MASHVETLGTDMFREHHRTIARELDEIEVELERVVADKSPWRTAAPSFRRLLVLFEVDVESLVDEEERLLYAPMRKEGGCLSPTLAACYREHHDIRVEAEALHRELLVAFSGHEPDPAALFERCARLINLLRVHMAREDEVLFLAAEQELPRQELLEIAGTEPEVPPAPPSVVP